MKTRINIFLSEVEGNNLKALLERYGGKAPAFIRTLLMKAYEKEFGGYKAKTGRVLTEKLTPEEQCEAAGGKVITRESDGVRVCAFQYSGAVRTIPLDQPNKFPKAK